MLTVLEAFTAAPLSLTLPPSQAAAAWVRVLNIRIAQRDLSTRSFSVAGILVSLFAHLRKVLVEVGDGLNSFVEVLQPVLLVGRVQVITIQAKAHEDGL